ncbi:MAG: hypothetical protein LBB64_01400 [Dysgonamonadaceae bacterium]|jgi:hypothetical protein|nr:hypothetical protein [Dysgonamonadaceae bacterium]
MKTSIQSVGYQSDLMVDLLKKVKSFNGVSFPLGYSMYCMQSRPACMRMCCC